MVTRLAWAPGNGSLFADDLDQHALPAVAVELGVVNLLPGAEVELAAGDRDHHLAAHDLALEVGIAVVFAGLVVAVARDGFVRSQALEPGIVVGDEPRLGVVDVDARGDVHGVDQAQPLADAALAQGGLDLGGDVEVVAAM